MLLTVLEGTVASERAGQLEAAFERATSQALPDGLLRSELLRDASDPDRWRLQTLWTDRNALDRMRAQGTPAGVLMFRAAGAEPALSVFTVVKKISAADR